ncbi:MAG: hypothetical protein FWC73_05185 [Defluviitaleaceae bacterium]|nr:hypothetical protein [Defluviitaleaceae bacterium]
MRAHDEIVIAVKEALHEYDSTKHRIPPRKPPRKKPPMEFSKKLIMGVLLFIGLAFVLSMVSWHLTGDWPKEIVEFFVWPFIGSIVGVVGYFFKSAYENKAKIQNNNYRDG